MTGSAFRGCSSSFPNGKESSEQVEDHDDFVKQEPEPNCCVIDLVRLGFGRGNWSGWGLGRLCASRWSWIEAVRHLWERSLVGVCERPLLKYGLVEVFWARVGGEVFRGVLRMGEEGVRCFNRLSEVSKAVDEKHTEGVRF